MREISHQYPQRILRASAIPLTKLILHCLRTWWYTGVPFSSDLASHALSYILLGMYVSIRWCRCFVSPASASRPFIVFGQYHLVLIRRSIESAWLCITRATLERAFATGTRTVTSVTSNPTTKEMSRFEQPEEPRARAMRAFIPAISQSPAFRRRFGFAGFRRTCWKLPVIESRESAAVYYFLESRTCDPPK